MLQLQIKFFDFKILIVSHLQAAWLHLLLYF